MKNNTLSIVVRAYDAEAPYIKSFIEHYKERNVDEFHIIVPKVNQSDVLVHQLKQYDGVNIHKSYPTVDPNNIEKLRSVALPFVTSTHILSIDVDEYLDIPDTTILLTEDYIKLNWLITPYSERKSKLLKGFKDRQSKYIVKKSIVESLEDHYCRLKSEVPQTEVDYSLIHYVYRSFKDVYLKCAISRYSCYQKSHEILYNKNIGYDITRIPHKLKMAAIYHKLVHCSDNVNVNNYCNPDKHLELLLIEKYGNLEDYYHLYELYLKYLNSIDIIKLTKKIKSTKEYKRYKRIPHYLLATLSDNCLQKEIEQKFFLP